MYKLELNKTTPRGCRKLHGSLVELIGQNNATKVKMEVGMLSNKNIGSGLELQYDLAVLGKEDNLEFKN